MSKHPRGMSGAPTTYLVHAAEATGSVIVLRQLAPAAVPLCGSALGNPSLVRTAGCAARGCRCTGRLGPSERLIATRIQAQAGVPAPHRASMRQMGFGPAEFFPESRAPWAAPVENAGAGTARPAQSSS